LCGGVDLPEHNKEYVVHLELYNYDKIEGKSIPVLRSRPDDVFAIHVEFNKDFLTVFNHQFISYVLIWLNKRPTDEPISVSFETDDEKLRPIVSKLRGISFSGDKAHGIDRDTLSKLLKMVEDYKNNGGNIVKG
jgi:hypothetical protein